MILCHQGVLAFFPLRMQLDALDRTNHLALGFVVVADAFSAFVGIDDIKLLSHRDRIVGTLWFANITVDALVGDAKCHVQNSRSEVKVPVPSTLGFSYWPSSCSEASAQPKETQIYSHLHRAVRFPSQSFRI